MITFMMYAFVRKLVCAYILKLGSIPVCAPTSDTWTISDLSKRTELSSSALRKHLAFWVSQGVLKETEQDEFTSSDCCSGENEQGARSSMGIRMPWTLIHKHIYRTYVCMWSCVYTNHMHSTHHKLCAWMFLN